MTDLERIQRLERLMSWVAIAINVTNPGIALPEEVHDLKTTLFNDWKAANIKYVELEKLDGATKGGE